MKHDATPPVLTLTPARANRLATAALRKLLNRFAALCNAHEVTVWIREGEHLVPAISSDGQPDFELKFRQPLAEGIVSKVYAEGRAFLEQGLWHAKERSGKADAAIGQITQHEMCVPLPVGGAICGVVSAVQITDGRHPAPVRWGFSAADLLALETAAMALGLLLEQAALLNP